MARALQHAPRMRVRVVVEDAGLAELLADALDDAGHASVVAEDLTALELAVATDRFDSAILDLDARSLDGADIARRLHERLPALELIVLLPCGGVAPPVAEVPHQLALAKPARLQALLMQIAK